MAGFTNQSIKAPVKGLPHICMREGWWCVSPLTDLALQPRWSAAHNFAHKLNDRKKANVTHARKRAKAGASGG